MALRTPDAPEQERNRIQESYDQGLNERELGNLGGVYTKHQDEIDARRQSLKGLKKDEENATSFGGTDDDIQSQEEQSGSTKGPWNARVTPSSSRGEGQRRFNLSSLKKKGPTSMILLFIAGILGFGGIFFGIALGPVAFFANITDDLYDPLSALEERGLHITGKKIRPGDATSIGCTKVGSVLSIKCKFSTMSEKMVDRYRSVGIEVSGETGGVFGNRVKPTTFRFQGRTYTAAEFDTAIRSSSGTELSQAYRRSHNMKFLGLNGDSFVRKTLGKFGVSLSPPELEGSHQDRVNRLMNQAGVSDINDLDFRPAVDANGEPMVDANGDPTHYTLSGDDSGTVWEASRVDEMNKSISRMKVLSHPLTQGVARSVNVLGWYDMACSIKNTIGGAAVAVKVSNVEQLIKYAMPVASLAGAMKAGEISLEDAQVLQEFMNDTDARKTISGLVTDEKSGETIVEEVPNPSYGKNAMDSELYKMSSNGGVASTSAVDTNYSLGFGLNNLASAAAGFANISDSVISGEIINKDINGCAFAQHWLTRTGGLVVGIGLGIFSVGASTAMTSALTLGMIGLSIIIDRALSSAISGDLITDSMDEAPVERGSAVWSGMAAVHSQGAQSRGMMPGNAEQIVAYQVEQERVRQEYIAFERQESNPLDVKNQYSLTGSIALSLSDTFPTSLTNSTVSELPSSLASFVFGGLSSILKPYSARAQSLDTSRYEQCDDESYKAIGIDADVQCNVRFVMPESSLSLDAIDVANYMEGNNPNSIEYVEKDTTTGLPKGYTEPNPSENQNLAKAFIMGQINSIYSTRDYVNDYGKFLDFCVYRVLPFGETYEENGSFGGASNEWTSGKNCMKEEAPFNYFRAYTFDKTVNDDLDESPVTRTGSTGGGGARITESQLLALIKEYGLPDPTPEGANGYQKLLSNLEGNDDASWSASSLLSSEKNFIDRGGELKEYLNTAWLWFENGASGWPDPYSINCNDNRTGYESTVSFHCSVGNFQVAGYQPADRSGDYVDMYNKFYSEDELGSILEKVLQNSSRASREDWSYNSASQKGQGSMRYLQNVSGATLDDIATDRNTLLTDQEKQFITLMLGKDPNMVTALNSYAVSDRDLINALRTSACGYGYICAKEKQLLANMIMALFQFDNKHGNPSGGRGSGSGIEAIWGGGSMQPTDEWGVTSLSSSGYYDNYAGGLGVPGAHPGLDYSLPNGSKVYSPVEGTVIYNGGTCYFRDDTKVRSDSSCDSGMRSNTRTGELKIKVAGSDDELIIGHMSQIDVDVGDTVSPNQLVGLSGTTTNTGGGPHIHVEYRIPKASNSSGQQAVDPRQYL